MKDQPAFPTRKWQAPDPNSSNWADDGCWFWIPGLTKRELFAAMAMQGLTESGLSFVGEAPLGWHKKAAPLAVQYADALIEELEKGKQ